MSVVRVVKYIEMLFQYSLSNQCCKVVVVGNLPSSRKSQDATNYYDRTVAVIMNSCLQILSGLGGLFQQYFQFPNVINACKVIVAANFAFSTAVGTLAWLQECATETQHEPWILNCGRGFVHSFLRTMIRLGKMLGRRLGWVQKRKGQRRRRSLEWSLEYKRRMTLEIFQKSDLP